MTVLRRLAFAASMVLCALLAVTAAGSAAGIATAAGGKGGGPLPPGEYRSTQQEPTRISRFRLERLLMFLLSATSTCSPPTPARAR
jgi:hypothetical protein